MPGVRDLLDATRLDGIDFLEFSGIRDPDAAGEFEANFSARGTAWGRRIETELTVVVTGQGAQLTVTAAAHYSRSSVDEIPASTRDEFMEKVAIMTLYPYLRESVQSLATRLGVSAPILPIIRPGEFAVERQNDESQDPASTPS